MCDNDNKVRVGSGCSISTKSLQPYEYITNNEITLYHNTFNALKLSIDDLVYSILNKELLKPCTTSELLTGKDINGIPCKGNNRSTWYNGITKAADTYLLDLPNRIGDEFIDKIGEKMSEENLFKNLLINKWTIFILCLIILFFILNIMILYSNVKLKNVFEQTIVE